MLIRQELILERRVRLAARLLSIQDRLKMQAAVDGFAAIFWVLKIRGHGLGIVREWLWDERCLTAVSV